MYSQREITLLNNEMPFYDVEIYLFNISIMIRLDDSDYDKTSELLFCKQNSLLTTTQRITCKQDFLLGIKKQHYTNTFHNQSGFVFIVNDVQVMKCFLVVLSNAGGTSFFV